MTGTEGASKKPGSFVRLFRPIAVLAVVAAGAEEIAARQPSLGEDLYRQHCAVCHGFDGISIPPDTPSFGRGEGLNKGDRELLRVIDGGKGQMPGWKKMLSKGEQREALGYIRTIPGRKVFEARCAECHNKVRFAQVLSAKLPRIEELEKKEGNIDVCRGTAVQKTISRREAAGIVRYMQSFKEP